MNNHLPHFFCPLTAAIECSNNYYTVIFIFTLFLNESANSKLHEDMFVYCNQY